MLYEAKDFIVPRDVAWPDVFDPNTLPPELRAYYGPHNVPFNEKLYFGTLSFQAGDASLFELSLRYRDADSISPGSYISRSAEHTYELQSLTRLSSAAF